jgi:hypothetical protein
MKTIKRFKTEAALKAFAAKKGMKFASSCVDGEENYEHFAADMRKRGLAVVECERFLGDDRSALLAFHP